MKKRIVLAAVAIFVCSLFVSFANAQGNGGNGECVRNCEQKQECENKGACQQGKQGGNGNGQCNGQGKGQGNGQGNGHCGGRK